jgi:hypothetical protein
LIALIAAIAAGLRVQFSESPEFLGNHPENINYIKTATDPNEFTFVVVGDVKGGTATFEAMLDIINADKPAFAVILGDFVDPPILISHKLFALEIAEHSKKFPILLVLGNHDISDDGSGFGLKDFEGIYGSCQFSFTIGSSLFVFLDVISSRGQTGEYLEFLDQTLANKEEKIEKTFVFMHIPPAGLNSSLLCRPLPQSEKFLQLVKKYHIDYVFAGDHHGYIKTEKDGTNFIVTGGGGAELRGQHGKFYHLVRMAVKNDTITETVVLCKKQLETAELLERNLVVRVWPLISYNSVSIAVTFVTFGLTVWLLIFSFRRRKQSV